MTLMNREIKFRAWVIGEKRMVYPDLVGEGVILTDFAYNGGLVEHDEYFYTPDFDDNDVFYLTQYTGLKDKNDKEIYEGDIVEYWFLGARGLKESPMRLRKEVKWLKDGVGFNLDTLEYDGGHLKPFYPLPYRREPSYEVIGNIYENPELLNE